MKRFLITAVSVTILFFVFKVMLFGVIGWHDGLRLDWYDVYYPAIQTFDPHSVFGYFNPPWLAWILSPLGLLTAVDAHVLWIVLILLLTVRCVYALGGGALAVVLTVISPGFLVTIMNGQVDVLVLLGLALGSWLLVLVKPQVAGMAVLYDVFKGRIDWASIAVAVVSAVVFVLFLSRPSSAGPAWGVSIAPWPWGLPLGALLFGWALFRRDKWLAALSTFFFAPYLSGSSLIVYSAIGTSRYGKLTAVLFAAAIWARGWMWFV